jgi:putative ABC transport system permease protein
MGHTTQIISTSITQALIELRANKLRTFLSLLGITIGIFCIIAVFTVLNSLEKNLQTSMATLGSDVLYINRWPWMGDESGEYKWWEFWRRPSMSPTELKAVEKVNDVDFATLAFSSRNFTLKRNDQELSNITGYAVTPHFDKIQNIEIESGRYLTVSELEGGSNTIVIGTEVYKELFPGNVDALGKTISFFGKSFIVVGVMKPSGQNMAGFNFDESIVYPFQVAASVMDVRSLNHDPVLMIKARNGANLTDIRYEVEGVLRRVRKVKPGESNNFAINQLSQVSAQMDILFGLINVIGSVIGGFSLIVGAFGIANIMFVTVKERTKVIGLKKAIGAKRSSILAEFLLEAITLCLAGGLIGILLVLILSVIVTYAADFEIILSIKNFLLGIGISGLVGVLAGFIPARAASRLDPVVAIRSN